MERLDRHVREGILIRIYSKIQYQTCQPNITKGPNWQNGTRQTTTTKVKLKSARATSA